MLTPILVIALAAPVLTWIWVCEKLKRRADWAVSDARFIYSRYSKQCGHVAEIHAKLDRVTALSVRQQEEIDRLRQALQRIKNHGGPVSAPIAEKALHP